MIIMTRRVEFSAAVIDSPAGALQSDSLRLDSARLSGHNYVLDVSVAGAIDPRTGVVVNIKEIDRIVRGRVTDRFNGRLINAQADEFRDRPATPEHLTEWIAAALRPHLPGQVSLYQVRLMESAQHASIWRAAAYEESRDSGSEQNMVLSTRSYEFAASHRLHSAHLSDEENRELFGKCNYANGHGHNYVLEVTVTGPVDGTSGRVVCPRQLDEIVHREVVDRYDHRHFNYDIPEFKDLVPSSEVVTKMIWDRLVDVIPAPTRLYSVLVRETARNIFEYRGEV